MTDPVSLGLGVAGVACGLLAAEIVLVVSLREFFAWRMRRRQRRDDRRVGPRVLDEGGWAPEWGPDWPQM